MTAESVAAAAPVEELTPYEEHVRRLIAAAPPLTDEQRVRLRAVFKTALRPAAAA